MSLTHVVANSVKGAIIKWPKVLLFGDSITQFSFGTDGCWGALLADHLQRKCDVVARGFSGYNTRWNKLILPRIIDADMAQDVVAVVILLGANDSNRSDLNPTQHVPLEEFKLNLIHMVEHLMARVKWMFWFGYMCAQRLRPVPEQRFSCQYGTAYETSHFQQLFRGDYGAKVTRERLNLLKYQTTGRIEHEKESVGVSREKVIIISPPPCDGKSWAKHCELKGRPMSKDETLTKQYAGACCSAATESGAQSIDFYSAVKKQENWETYLNDGLHLSTRGSVFLDSLLWPQVEKLTASLPNILPNWDEVDYKHPEKSLTE